MRGKKTNVFLGILNIMLGILLIIYVFYMMSNNRLELTRHQRFVINIQHNIWSYNRCKHYKPYFFII